MNFEEKTRMDKFNSLPDMLIRISNQDAVVHKIVDLYLYETIITKEEMYLKIIQVLSESRKAEFDRLVNQAQNELKFQITKYPYFNT